MSKQQWKGGTLLAPLPVVMVSCGTTEKPNIITIAWTGILASEPPKTYVSVRKERFSYDMIKNSGEFVINLVNAELVKSADYCGVASGRNVDKFDTCGLTPKKAFKLDCPIIEESPLSLECKVSDIIPLGSHDMFIADIVSVDVEESLIDAKGRLDLNSAELVSYSHGEYCKLGKKLGTFGFSVRKKPKTRRGAVRR
ncbi:MAG: flavin reductase family protein [Clostridiales bacterium]|nr:flavin reductase family protein [Clostridiales bacterium]MDD7550393.1 flavin reductase family protein [Clostridia bacterium]MDY5753977.1 flavin reductase family protein [Eubacteriales bacterium]